MTKGCCDFPYILREEKIIIKKGKIIDDDMTKKFINEIM